MGQPHLAVTSGKASVTDVRCAPTKLRLLTGADAFQANGPAFNKNNNKKYLICGQGDENHEHFLLKCVALSECRKSYMVILSNTVQEVLSLSINTLDTDKLLSLIIDIQHFVTETVICHKIDLSVVEEATRHYCYGLHCERNSKLNQLPRNTKAQMSSTKH